MTIKIIGTGVGLPQRQVGNDELAALTGIDTSDEWIRTRTGISTRRLCTDETLTDLATTAANGALTDAGTDAGTVDYLLCATLAGDTRTPALACLVAERLGVTCPAVDLNGACVGFLYALDSAAALIAAKRATTVLIVCAEKMSAHVDFTDRSTCVLFGDGAAAVVVTASSSADGARDGGLEYIHLGTQPDSHTIVLPNNMLGNNPVAVGDKPQPFLYMDGQKVFKFAVNVIEQEIRLALKALNITPDAIDHYLIHQANRRIIDFAVQQMGIGPDKFPLNVEKYGNMSAVSIPVLLHEMRARDEIHAGERLLLCAFGAGMTYGACVIQWE